MRVVSVVIALSVFQSLVDGADGTESKCVRDQVKTKAKTVSLRIGDSDYELIRVEPGSFVLGAPQGEVGFEAADGPGVKVNITKPFYLGKLELNRIQFHSVMGERLGELAPKDEEINFPVQKVARETTMTFIAKVSKSNGLKVTLPTEAQWEYACRANSTSRFCSGDSIDDLDSVAWFKGNSDESAHPVGKKKPNAWGFYDMHGNVPEHCLDLIEGHDQLQRDDPIGILDAEFGGLRGGRSFDPAEKCRSARRSVGSSWVGGGIRLCINPHDPPSD